MSDLENELTRQEAEAHFVTQEDLEKAIDRLAWTHGRLLTKLDNRIYDLERKLEKP